MSSATDDLRTKATLWRAAQSSVTTARITRDDAKRALTDAQSVVFVAKTTDGTIDGKNAETRDAQAQLAYKADAAWRAAWDTYVNAENALVQAQAEFDWAKVDLQVQATIVNAEIAQSGASRLLAEVGLASV